MKPWVLAGWIGLGSLAGLAGAVGLNRVLPGGPVARGVRIGGLTAPQGDARGWLKARARAEEARLVGLYDDEHSFARTAAELGASIDVEATLASAARVAHEGSLARRLREAAAARRGELDVPLVWRVDPQKAETALTELAPLVHVAAVDAKLDVENRRRIDALEGSALDVAATAEATARALESLPASGEVSVRLLARSLAPRVSLDHLASLDLTKVVHSYETTFATYGVGVGRSQNIRTAAAKLDGVILLPGVVFSFNETVGPRTLENGFTYAPEIQGDELRTGVGGGTCQVSTTLHLAALFGALEIVERRAHSRPSSYVPMGLDAAVSYPITDLKIRNTLSHPVVIHAYVPEPPPDQAKALKATIRVELLGGDPVAKVTWKTGVGSMEDFTRRIYIKPHFERGRYYRHQKGSRGYGVTSFVRLEFVTGRVEERTFFSDYRPVPEVLWVAPGTSDAELPPLPEHAKGTEELGRKGRLRKPDASDDPYVVYDG